MKSSYLKEPEYGQELLLCG